MCRLLGDRFGSDVVLVIDTINLSISSSEKTEQLRLAFTNIMCLLLTYTIPLLDQNRDDFLLVHDRSHLLNSSCTLHKVPFATYSKEFCSTNTNG